MSASATTALALPLPHAHFIWYCAWFSLPSAIYAYSHSETAHFAIVPAAVFTTSLMYWRNPVRNSWRRTLDIAVVFSGMTYQTYYAYAHTPAHTHAPAHTHTHIYTALIGASTVCYAISNYLMTRGRVWPATLAHAAIHIIANVANLVLYESVIKL